MSKEQERAVDLVAKAFGWDALPTQELGLLLWALFRYYAKRAGAELR